MAEQVLPIFKTHTGGTKPTTEGMTEVMNPDIQGQSFAGGLPRSGVHGPDTVSPVGEHRIRMIPPPFFNDVFGHPIQDHHLVLTILNLLPRNDENSRVQFSNGDLVLPPEAAHLAVSTSRIDGEQAHHAKIFGKGIEKDLLFIL
jgi:hypothetical protein